MHFFCGHVVRGALAGNGGEMAEAGRKLQAQKPSSQKGNTASRKPRSRTGSKATKRTGTQTSKKKTQALKGAKDVCVDGAGRLRDAANRALAKRSRDIADELAERAAHGNTTCAKMLVDLTAGKMPEPQTLTREMTTAQELMRDQTWEEEQQAREVELGTGSRE
jgi:hypothetical protein